MTYKYIGYYYYIYNYLFYLNVYYIYISFNILWSLYMISNLLIHVLINVINIQLLVFYHLNKYFILFISLK